MGIDSPPTADPASSGAPAADEEAILATVTGLIGEVIGEEALFDTEVTMATSFDEDLELESIEFVALSGLLQSTYGEQVDFVAWLSEMDLEALMGLRVGDLVHYIAANVG